MHSYAVNNDRLKWYVAIGIVCAILTPIIHTWLQSKVDLSWTEPWVSSGVSFATLYAIFFAAFNRYLWKWKFLQYFGLPMTSNLSGTYEGVLTSSYKETKVDIQIEITQTWTKIVIYLATKTTSSDSYSYMASIIDIDGKSSRLTYSYTNTPFDAIADPDMRPHDGTVNLVFRNSGKIVGKYFNARKRTGTIELKKK